MSEPTPEMTLKQRAMQKKEFLNSDFGKFAAQKINEMYAKYHTAAEDRKLEPWQKAYLTERAGAITDVIDFFTNDVALLDAGYFEEKEEPKKGGLFRALKRS